MKHQTVITKDLPNKKLNVSREFDGPLEKVWRAWTEAELLDKWWAPRPWKTETSSMDFSEGGRWLYSMVGPTGERHYCKAYYLSIETEKSMIWNSNFCDAEGNTDHSFPSMHWLVEFEPTPTGTLVKTTHTFENEADLEKIVEMGFREGYTMAHGNLDELLAAN